MNAKWMSTAAGDTLSSMQLHLAQVLNTIAHEIRTPLAVSQGYLKLYLDGRLTDADDQRRAFQQTRDALGTLATLCNDMTKVGALSEASRSEEHTSELQSLAYLVCRLLLEKKKIRCRL